jgi:hypothetical protein
MTFRLASVFLLSCALLSLVFAQQGYDPNKPPPFFKGKKEKDDPTIRALQGTVKDLADAPLDGAIVKVKNIKTLQIRSFITKQNGAYQFGGLSTNADYEVWADHKGASSEIRTLSVFDSRKIAILNLKVDPAKKSEKPEQKPNNP